MHISMAVATDRDQIFSVMDCWVFPPSHAFWNDVMAVKIVGCAADFTIGFYHIDTVCNSYIVIDVVIITDDGDNRQQARDSAKLFQNQK